MRLFIAINFTDENKSLLADAANTLRENSRKGNFTRKENFHITLAFLGDIAPSRFAAIRRVIDSAAQGRKPFDFTISGLGRFKRTGGDIYWMGVERKPELSELAGEIIAGLNNSGFDIEDREFKPHITLGREVLLNCDSRTLTMPKVFCNAHRISLMKSERIKGVLTYSEVYGKELD